MITRRFRDCKSLQIVITTCIVLCVIFIIIASYNLATESYYEKKTREHLENNYLNVAYNYSKVEQIYQFIDTSKHKLRSLKDDVTVVTAYFSLGSFRKGDRDIYTTDLYRKWIKIFKNIENPVVAYFDSHEFCDYFKVLRQHLPSNITKVIYVEKNDLWAFQMQSQIEEIFRQPGYPKYSPNTINSEYSCAMHAKYELMNRTIISNFFNTKYFSWVDVGLFRHLKPDHESQFGISTPPHFSNTSVAYGLVRRRIEELRPIDVVYSNSVWVCGCFFVGRMDVMLRWTLEYMEGVEWLLKKKLMNTDQQVIYILKNGGLIKTSIQVYDNRNSHPAWFHLGYLAKDEWMTRKAKQEIIDTVFH